MNIALVEANDDDVTRPVHDARRTALAQLDNGPHRIEKLFAAQATAQSLRDAYLRVPGTFGLISGMGHGSAEEFTGQHGNIVFSRTAPHTAIRESVVHLFSCNCGNGLGASLCAQGAKAFIGYTDYVSVPNETSLTRYFVQEAAAIDRAISDGKNQREVKAAADASYANARAALLADPLADPTAVAEFENNHATLVGPWTSSSWGAF